MTLPYTNRCQQPRLLKAGPNPLFALGPYQVYGQITHHTLTQLSFTGRGKPQETGLLDGCLEFFQGQKKAIIAKTSLREVESFLRTENHIPAFDPPALSPYFETIREQLLRTLTRAESPLVCTCFKVSYQTIEEELLAHLDLPALIAKLKISTGCGSCLRVGRGKRFSYLEDIYRGVVAKLKRGYYASEEYHNLHRQGFSSLGDQAPLALPLPKPFAELSLLQKIRTTTLVLDHKVRPFLQRDGGDLVLEDIQGSTMLITYCGACENCPSAQQGTLEFIREALATELKAPDLSVITS